MSQEVQSDPLSLRARSLIRLAGLVGVVGIAATVWLGLWVTPPALGMGNLVRLLYIHPPVAWVCYLAFGVSAAASLAYLWPRTRAWGWDRLAGASAEVGVCFALLTIASGSIWGRPTWGVWWTWDARLTSTAIMTVLYIGYLVLRRSPGVPEATAKRSAVAGVLAFMTVPINYLSVYWWKTLHQTGTVLDPSKQLHVHGIMAWTLLIAFCSFTLIYVWMVGTRYESAVLEDLLSTEGVDAAIAERLAEAPVMDQGGPYRWDVVMAEPAGQERTPTR
jgi:heme exporter protein C